MSAAQRSIEILNDNIDQFDDFEIHNESTLFDEFGNYKLGDDRVELAPNKIFASYSNLLQSQDGEYENKSNDSLFIESFLGESDGLLRLPIMSSEKLNDMIDEALESDTESKDPFNEVNTELETPTLEEEQIDEVDPSIIRNEIIESIVIELEKREQLKVTNNAIQQKLALYYKNKNSIKKSNGPTSNDLEKRYIAIIEQYTSQNTLYETIKSDNDLALKEIKEKTNQKFEECKERIAENIYYCAKVAGSAVSGRTGKLLGTDVIHTMNSAQSKKFSHVMEIRSENLKVLIVNIFD